MRGIFLLAAVFSIAAVSLIILPAAVEGLSMELHGYHEHCLYHLVQRRNDRSVLHMRYENTGGGPSHGIVVQITASTPTDSSYQPKPRVVRVDPYDMGKDVSVQFPSYSQREEKTVVKTMEDEKKDDREFLTAFAGEYQICFAMLKNGLLEEAPQEGFHRMHFSISSSTHLKTAYLPGTLQHPEQEGDAGDEKEVTDMAEVYTDRKDAADKRQQKATGVERNAVPSKIEVERMKTLVHVAFQMANEVRRNSVMFLHKDSEMRTTSETIFTRTWIFSLLTMATMALSGALMAKQVKNAIQRKREF